jgi:hypothetical protein
MLRKLLIAAAAFGSIAVMSAVPATAQGFAPQTCLRNNRIWSWDATGPSTMVVTDRQRNRYLVRLSGGCYGLQENLYRVNLRTATRLGCLRAGDRVSYQVPGWGRETCFIRNIRYLGNPRYGMPDVPYDRNPYRPGIQY